jgi:hypothetical protein
VWPPGTTWSPDLRQDLVTTSTLAVSVSRPPYCASITWTALSLPVPARSTRRTAVSLQAGTSSPGPGRQGVTSGRAADEALVPVVDVVGATAPAEPDAVLAGPVVAGREPAGGSSSDAWPPHPAASTPSPTTTSVRRGRSTSPA